MEIGQLRESSKPVRCAYCHASVDGEVAVCEGCGTQLHADCAKALTTCPTIGCPELPRARRRTIVGRRTIVLGAALVLGAVLASGIFLALMHTPERKVTLPPRRHVETELGTPLPPEQHVHPVFAAWADCGVGSFVTTSVDAEIDGWESHTKTTTTLVELPRDKIVLETTGMEWRAGEVRDLPTTRQEISKYAPGFEGWPTNDRLEELEIAGQKLVCRLRSTETDANGLKGIATTWLCDAIPGHVAKTVSVTEGPVKSRTSSIVTAFEKK